MLRLVLLPFLLFPGQAAGRPASSPEPAGMTADQARREIEASPAGTGLASRRARVEALAAGFPENPEVQTSAARFSLQDGDAGLALARAERAMALLDARESRADASALVRALYARSLGGFLLGDHPRANRDAQRLLRLDPGNRGAFELERFTRGRPKDDARPGAPASETVSRAFALERADAPLDPRQWMARQKKSPTRAGKLALQALQDLRNGDWAQALKLADAAVQADPADPMARFQRGWLRGRLKDHDGAAADLSRAIAGGWQEEALFVQRADALLKAGRHREALADADRAVALDPKNAPAYFLRAMAELGLGHNGLAVLADLEAAARIKPDPYATFFEKAKDERRSPWAGAVHEPARRSAGPLPGRGWAGLASYVSALGAGIILLVSAILLLLAVAVWLRVLRPRIPVAGRRASPSGRPGRTPRVKEGDVLGGHYRLGKVLGKGATGVVYDAWDLDLDRRMAVKLLCGKPLDDLGGRDRALLEARAAAKLKHPNIAAIHQVLELDGGVGLVFEFLDGRALDALLAESPGQGLPLSQALPLIKQVCDALGFAHARRAFHRGLRPSDIVVHDGVAKVTGFGPAGAAADAPDYAPPQPQLGPAGKKADLYSLGVCAYEMLAGARPFSGEQGRQDKRLGRVRGLAASGVAVPPGVDAFFKKALSPDPESGFHSAAEFYAALSASVEGTPAG
ncbi:MAG: protein kinase [Elusimicrobia bacterium]|nr:protein kinase [Elusimicrobiota bacterium]